jgi:8-oxo-dGTP diphosphatase
MEQKPRLTAAVLVMHEGKFLLAERNKENYNGYWIIPGGGVEFGEKIEDAALREIKQETNLDVDIVKQICYKEIINVPGNYHSIVFYFLAKPKNPDMDVKADDDVSKANFFSIDEIKKMKIAESVELVLKEAGFWN